MEYASDSSYNFRYDYTKCMVMKLMLAVPDQKGGSRVLMNFEQALEAIKKIDLLTQGVPKIYYLVGWQYNGHDDKYPDFFEVNPALRRMGDDCALDSFLWLYEQAKQYHSVVSVHINFNDVYTDAPSFERFIKANALIRDKKGKPWAIERYNGKPCYKTSFKEYWESGLFAGQFDRLLTILPLEACGTVHVDNFQCYHNNAPTVTIGEMQDARREMISYVRSKGIDITSEFTYREDESLPNKKLFGLPREHNPKAELDTLGLIPASWWCTRMRRKEYVEIPPQLYGGFYKDKRYANYLYGNMHGEPIIKPSDPNWTDKFLYEFATMQVPYHFLCQFKRMAIKGHGRNERCLFQNGIISYNKNRKIVYGDIVLKERDTLLLPLPHRKNEWIAYSAVGDSRTWRLMQEGARSAKIYRITPNGNELVQETAIENNSLPLKIKKREGLLLKVSTD